MKAKYIILIGFALLLAHPFALQAQIPKTLAYQGIVTDAAGEIKPNDTYSFTFRLYDAASGGSALWTESKTIPVKDGLFFTALGDQAVFPASLSFDQPYWLGIQVGSESELAPRIPLTSVGYSFSTLRADSAQHAVRADTASFALSVEIAGDSYSLDAADGDPTDVVYVDTAGYVGIGTTSPEDVFTISKTLQGGSGPETETLTFIPGSTERGNPASIVTSFSHVRFITPANISVDGSGVTDVSITTKDASVLGTLGVGGNASFQGNVNISGTVTLPTTTRYYSIPAVSFIPASNVATYNLYMYGNAVYPSSGSAYFYAQVNLPHGATITQFQPVLYDNAGSDITFRLVSVNNSGVHSVITTVTSSGSSIVYRSISPGALSVTVDNQNYAYLVYASWSTPAAPSDIRISKVNIAYTVTNPLP